MQIYCVLTLDCNLHCQHCIREFAKIHDETQVCSDRFSDIFSLISRDNKKHQIVLTGGEPTLHKDFFHIMDAAVSYFDSVVICTNGIISCDTLKKLCNYKNVRIQISIDGDENSHDMIRGTGSFKKAVSTMQIFLERNVPVVISSTVSSKNIESMFRLSEILSQYNILQWKISLEQMLSNEEILNFLRIEEWNFFVDKIIHKAKNKLSIKKLFDFALFSNMEEKYGRAFLEKKAVKNCGFCSSKIYIYPDFSVKACTCIPNIIIGNLKENSFSEIQERMKEIKKTCIPKSDSPCSSCRWNYLCNGGCPGYSFYFKGEIGFGDLRCPIVRNFYEI